MLPNKTAHSIARVALAEQILSLSSQSTDCTLSGAKVVTRRAAREHEAMERLREL